MHLPANTFSAQHQSRGQDVTTSAGIIVTASGTANTKGSWTQVGSNTGFAYEGITLYVSRSSASADYIVDIGIDDGSGNVFVLVENFYFSSIRFSAEFNTGIHIPVHVPDNAVLVARCSASTASATVRVVIVGHSANPGGYPGFSRAIALFTPATSRAVAVDPGGSANTKGSWVQLTASSGEDVAAVFGVVGFNGDFSRAATASMLLDIGVGAASSEFVAVPNVALSWEQIIDGPSDIFFGPFAADIPLGTRVAARAQCDITTAGDRTADLALYGLVP